MIQPYNEILPSNRKKRTINTCNNMAVLQNNYSEGTKPDKKKKSIYFMVSFIQNSGNCKLIYSDRKQINSWLGSGLGGIGERDIKQHCEIYRDDRYVHYLNYNYCSVGVQKIFQVVHFEFVQLLVILSQ